jgi:hypothetical protein
LPFAAARAHRLNRKQFPATHDQRFVEIIDRGTDVARDEKQQVANRRDFGA